MKLSTAHVATKLPPSLGGNVSAMSLTPVPNRAAVAQFNHYARNTRRAPRQPSTSDWSKLRNNKPGGGPRGGTGGRSRGGSGSGTRAERLKYGYPGCRKPSYDRQMLTKGPREGQNARAEWGEARGVRGRRGSVTKPSWRSA